ncbi:MAG: hypothetical protein MUF00_05885 [Gemmatimonadaceae bacterium]|jgi:hypothetical protein|nr:hypothetical protein [Gemmatimonadaceae bacterium]
MLVKNGQPIADLTDWERRAGPKHPSQWKEGRSAMEAARAWVAVRSPDLPLEVSAALASHADVGTVVQWRGEPEVRLPLDERRGEPRNTDLLIEARDDRGNFLIAVEAKADESFDRRMGDVLVDALEAKIANPGSGALARAQDLALSMLSPREAGWPGVAELRYQLFTAAVGVLRAAESRGITRAVLLIHEFETVATDDERHAANATALNAWLHRVSRGRYAALDAGRMVGPVRLQPGPLLTGRAVLYVAKAVRRLRVGGA